MKHDKNKVKNKIVIESFMVFLIAITPFVFKVYDYLPDNNAEETVSFLGITIGSNGFNSVSTHIWFITGKIIPLYLLIFWFFTCKQWWYHIILIPICMYAFQLFEVFSESKAIDTSSIWWVIPVCMVVIPFVYFIRIKLYDKYVNGIDLKAMEEELENLKAKRDSNEQINYSKRPGAFKQIFLDVKSEVINIASLCKEGVQELFNMKG